MRTCFSLGGEIDANVNIEFIFEDKGGRTNAQLRNDVIVIVQLPVVGNKKFVKTNSPDRVEQEGIINIHPGRWKTFLWR